MSFTDALWQQNRLLGVQVALASPNASCNPSAGRRQWRFLEVEVQRRRLTHWLWTGCGEHSPPSAGPPQFCPARAFHQDPLPHFPGHSNSYLCPVRTSHQGLSSSLQPGLPRNEISSISMSGEHVYSSYSCQFRGPSLGILAGVEGSS